MRIALLASALVMTALCGEAWCGGSVSGMVLYRGDIPPAKRRPVTADSAVCGQVAISEDLIVGKRGGLANAVVSIEGAVIGAGKMKPPAGGFAVDQVKCRFEPHVVVVPMGENLTLKNSDPINHSLHTLSRTNPPQSVMMTNSLAPVSLKFDRPETFNAKCDIHPWMSVWIAVAENPYYAVTGDDGRYALNDIPAGDYNLVVWQETLGTRSRRISVKEGEDLRFDVTYSVDK